jgi:anaphase-promoting complex subunit 5
MGLAGLAKRQPQKRKEHLTEALEFVNRAFSGKHHAINLKISHVGKHSANAGGTDYSRLEDIKGEREMMAKKATIMYLLGDMVLANDYAAKYMDLKETA